MYLLPLQVGAALTGTATLEVPTGIFGGALITADGTNSATVTIREEDGSGRIIFDVDTTSSMPAFAPFKIRGNTIHYTISGTGASAKLYAWHSKRV